MRSNLSAINNNQHQINPAWLCSILLDCVHINFEISLWIWLCLIGIEFFREFDCRTKRNSIVILSVFDCVRWPTAFDSTSGILEGLQKRGSLQHTCELSDTLQVFTGVSRFFALHPRTENIWNCHANFFSSLFLQVIFSAIFPHIYCISTTISRF